MHLNIQFRACVTIIAATLCAAAIYGLPSVAQAASFDGTATVAAPTPAQTFPPIQELPTLCRAAKSQFRPLTQADAALAKTELKAAVDRLDKRLGEAGTNGEDWRKYLQWTELQAELNRPEGPDVGKATTILMLYNADIEGLDLMWFLDVQQSLRNYLATLNAVDNPKVKEAFDQLFDGLAARLEAYAAKPNADDAYAIADSLRRLNDARQASELIRAIQHYYVHTNFAVEISAGLTGVGIAGPVDDTTSVRDCILGTDLVGTAHTVGQTTVELASSDKFSVIDTLFFGTTMSNTVGYHGPVTAFGSATTTFGARKRLWLNADGLSALPTASNAVTNSQVHDIQSRKDCAVVEKMAWKRAAKQKGQVEYIASRHAEERLNRRINEQAAETLEKVNQSYKEKLYKPFSERKLFPSELQFSSTPQALRIMGLEAGNVRLAASTPAPAVVGGADLSLCVHESMINNLAADALTGRTIHEERLQVAAIETFGHLPERMKGDEDGVPWAITFARKQPISVSFADNGFKITLRGAKFYKGQDGHPGMDVSASYKFEQTAEGFKAVRQGDIQVFPPDFVPGSGAKIDARRQIIRKLLEKRFAKVFEPEIISEGLTLPGKWEAAGKLTPIQLTSQDGWLVIAWKRPEGQAAASTTASLGIAPTDQVADSQTAASQSAQE